MSVFFKMQEKNTEAVQQKIKMRVAPHTGELLIAKQKKIKNLRNELFS